MERSNAVSQFKRLQCCPADIQMKTNAILAKVYAVAVYGIEASKVPMRRTAELTTFVVDVFRSRNNTHDTDWFLATFTDDKRDIDPQSQILTRRVLQLRRTYCKNTSTIKQAQTIMIRYMRNSRHQPPPWYHYTDVYPQSKPHGAPTTAAAPCKA